jgi:hypothetical protein
MQGVNDRVSKLERDINVQLKEKVDKKEFDDRMAKHSIKCTDEIGKVRNEVNDLKKVTSDLETKLEMTTEAKLVTTIDKKKLEKFPKMRNGQK